MVGWSGWMVGSDGRVGWWCWQYNSWLCSVRWWWWWCVWVPNRVSVSSAVCLSVCLSSVCPFVCLYECILAGYLSLSSVFVQSGFISFPMVFGQSGPPAFGLACVCLWKGNETKASEARRQDFTNMWVWVEITRFLIDV